MDTGHILLLLLGLIFGGIFTWLIFRARKQQSHKQIMDSAILQARAGIEAERATLIERIRSQEMQMNNFGNMLRDKDVQLANLQKTNSTYLSRQAELETKLREEQKASQEKLALLNVAQQRLADTFKALSADALQHNNQSFLTLAQTSLENFHSGAKSDLEKRQQAIDEMVKPVKEILSTFDGKIQELEKVRIGAYSSLNEQVLMLRATQDQLRSETSNLVKALRAPVVRGRWGEIQLRRVVEMAGMINHCDFYEQESTDTEEGRLRPDLVVRLPGKKTIVIDAKAPLEAYLDAMQTEDDGIRKAKLRNHASQIRTHIASLSKKSYWSQFQPGPEFVVLFLPGEVFFSSALEQDPSLIEIGVEERVILATPTTLIALLRAVVYGWNQESVTRNAQEIAILGHELYKSIVKMSEHWRKVGKGLSTAIETYNQATGSLESRVLSKARKFREFETVSVGEEIEELPPIDRLPRELQLPEIPEALAGSV